MPKQVILFSLFFISLLMGHAWADERIVLEDDGVTLSYDELAYQVEQWTPQMRDVANKDEGDRLELVNMVLANKKLAAEYAPLLEKNPALKIEFQAGIEAYQREFVLRHYQSTIELPDFTELARERYVTQKDKYALVPERRMSSHILIGSPPGKSRDDALAEAEEVLQQLRDGADFVEMVEEHSGEPRAAEKKGKFDRWIKYGEIGVSPPYSEGLFSIGEVGEYSEPVQTQYGVHIIRLDGIKEQHYKPFDQVKAEIERDLAKEYLRLAMKDFITGFNMSDEAYVDNTLVEEILAPYVQAEASTATEAGESAAAAGAGATADEE